MICPVCGAFMDLHTSSVSVISYPWPGRMTLVEQYFCPACGKNTPVEQMTAPMWGGR